MVDVTLVLSTGTTSGYFEEMSTTTYYIFPRYGHAKSICILSIFKRMKKGSCWLNSDSTYIYHPFSLLLLHLYHNLAITLSILSNISFLPSLFVYCKKKNNNVSYMQ